MILHEKLKKKNMTVEPLKGIIIWLTVAIMTGGLGENMKWNHSNEQSIVIPFCMDEINTILQDIPKLNTEENFIIKSWYKFWLTFGEPCRWTIILS